MTDNENSGGKYLAVAADTMEKATERAYDLINGRVTDQDGKVIVVPKTVKLIYLHQRSELYLLYGKFGVFFDIAPGTEVKPWHQQFRSHVRAGRLSPVRQLQTRLSSGESREVKWSHNDDDDVPLVPSGPRASSDDEESELMAVQAS